MSAVVAHPLTLDPPQMAPCCARSTRVCPTSPYGSGIQACPYSCPTPVCPVHSDDTQHYCTEQCFTAAHPKRLYVTTTTSPTNNTDHTTTAAHPPPTTRSPNRVGKYVLGDTLGQGAFGKVRLGEHSESGVMRAIKIIDKAKVRAAGMGEQIKREIRVMRAMQHNNVVGLVEVLASPTSIYLVLELVAGGELFDVIVEKGRLEESEAKRYFRQLVSGLSYCHQRGVCHRDLKPENLLLDDDGVLKISDFGLAMMQEQDTQDGSSSTDDLAGTSPTGDSPASTTPQHLVHTTCGTPNYVAPEVLMDKGYDGKAADVWSAGVILYVLLAGFLPFDEVSMVDLFRKIMKADFSYPAWFSDEAKDLLAQLLTPNADQRATMQQIQEHPWLKEGEKDEEAVVEEVEVEQVDSGKEEKEGESDNSATNSSSSLSTLSAPSLCTTSAPVSSPADGLFDVDAQMAMAQFYAETQPNGAIGSAAYDPELYVIPSPRDRSMHGAFSSRAASLKQTSQHSSSDAWDEPVQTAVAWPAPSIKLGGGWRFPDAKKTDAVSADDEQHEQLADSLPPLCPSPRSPKTPTDSSATSSNQPANTTSTPEPTTAATTYHLPAWLDCLDGGAAAAEGWHGGPDAMKEEGSWEGDKHDWLTDTDTTASLVAPFAPSPTPPTDTDTAVADCDQPICNSSSPEPSTTTTTAAPLITSPTASSSSSSSSRSPRRRRMSEPGDLRLLRSSSSPVERLNVHLSFHFTDDGLSSTRAFDRPWSSHYKFRFHIS